MKVENNKELFFEKLNKDKIKMSESNKQENFACILEKRIKKEIEDYGIKVSNEEKERTSIFFEKKVGKNRTDIFDTLIDI